MKRKPYRIKKRRPVWRTKLFWRIFIIAMFLGEVLYSVYFLEPFQIKNIEISGNEKIKTASIEGIIQNQINKTVMFFQTKSIFLIAPLKIEKIVLTDFPQIATVSLKRKFPNTLVVDIIERKPAAIFCQTDNCFNLDKEGIVFEPNLARAGLVKIMNLVSGPDIKLGEEVVGKDLLNKILEIGDKVENDIKILLDKISVVSDDRLNVGISDGWEIYFDPQKDLSWQFTKLKAVLDKEIPQEKRKNLEYIDLRFGNFAPYKYKQS
ncbi:MAG: FtsQ-type POTRA domain-containing protein [Candidatus Wildermuthbacteria bacterium]|nr:FtsQ-type POTRA domain-containing protein [Candidatus Wildermuthbacteria bacterium]